MFVCSSVKFLQHECSLHWQDLCSHEAERQGEGGLVYSYSNVRMKYKYQYSAPTKDTPLQLRFGLLSSAFNP